MSGALSATTVAAISAGIGAVSTVAGIVQGSKQAGAQKKALKSQENAQKQAEGQALSQQRKSEMAQNAADMKTPDISAILARASQSGSGVSGTMLTGPGGVNPNDLDLGKTSLLGK